MTTWCPRCQSADFQHCCFCRRPALLRAAREPRESRIHRSRRLCMLRCCICPSCGCDVQSASGCVMHCFVAACAAAAYSAAYAAACADAYCSPPVRRAAMLCSLLPLCSYASPVLLRFVSTSTKISRARSSPSTEQCAACLSAARRVAWMRARTHECAASGLAAPAPYCCAILLCRVAPTCLCRSRESFLYAAHAMRV